MKILGHLLSYFNLAYLPINFLWSEYFLYVVSWSIWLTPVNFSIIQLQQLVNCCSPVLNYVALLEVSCLLSYSWFNRCGIKFLVSRDSLLISRPIIFFCEECYLLKLSFSANDIPGWHRLNRSSGSDISWQYLKVSKIEINNKLLSHFFTF